ncbi:MAG: hypothetical protein NT137_01010 [Methanomassiliicoccales archaeon]|nr:hypothetical protein [Methanomassiliicoccales archaeon]
MVRLVVVFRVNPAPAKVCVPVMPSKVYLAPEVYGSAAAVSVEVK